MFRTECILLLVVYMFHTKCVGAIAEGSSSNGTEETSSSTEEAKIDSTNPVLEPSYGYRNENLTQPIGYGSSLHPLHYHQSRLQRYYSCVTADDCKSHHKGRKYYRHKTHILNNGKFRFFVRRKDDQLNVKRNDGEIYGEYFMNPHTRFIKDINSLSEDSDVLQKYPYESPTPQILLPADAEILIVNKRPNVPMILSPVESVMLAPPSIHTDSTPMHSGPMKVYVTQYRPVKTIPNQLSSFGNGVITTRKPMNPIAQEVNQASHPYKFVTPFIEDVFRTKYKKAHKVVKVINNQRQNVAASSQVLYKTKLVPNTPLTVPTSNLSFWEKFVLTFFRLAK